MRYYRTGEFREPKKGEWYEAGDASPVLQTFDPPSEMPQADAWILCKKPEKPDPKTPDPNFAFWLQEKARWNETEFRYAVLRLILAMRDGSKPISILHAPRTQWDGDIGTALEEVERRLKG